MAEWLNNAAEISAIELWHKMAVYELNRNF